MSKRVMVEFVAKVGSLFTQTIAINPFQVGSIAKIDDYSTEIRMNNSNVYDVSERYDKVLEKLRG